MKPKATVKLCFSFCVLAIGAFAIYDYYQSKKNKQQQFRETVFLKNIELKDLKSFRLVKNNNSLSALKKDKSWILTAPIQDQASFTEIARWFDEIKRQTVQKIDQQNPDWAAYHLVNSPYVELKLKSGETVIFYVSSKKSFDDKSFIKKNNQLFIGANYFFNEVNAKNFEDFRNKKILPSLNHATRIEYNSKFTLNWRSFKWFLAKNSLDKIFGETSIKTKPTTDITSQAVEAGKQANTVSKATIDIKKQNGLKKRDENSLDQERLNKFWIDVTSLEADTLLKKPSNYLKKYHLNKPQLILNLVYGEQSFIFKMSAFIDNKAYVTISHRDYIFEISKEKASKILLVKKDIIKKKKNKIFNKNKNP